MSLDDLYNSLYGEAPSNTEGVGSLFDQLYGSDEEETQLEKLQRERNQMYSGALPALGKVSDEVDFPVTIDALASVYRNSVAGLGVRGMEAAGVLPKQFTETVLERMADAGGGFVYGLAERAGALPEGTRQQMRQDVEERYTDVAAQNTSPLATGAMFAGALGAEFAGGGLGGGVSRAAVKPASKFLMNAIEGAGQAYGETAGIPEDQQGEAMLKALALSALGGTSEALSARATAKPKPLPKPALAAEQVASDIAGDLDLVDAFRNEVVQSKLNLDAQKAAGIMTRRLTADQEFRLKQLNDAEVALQRERNNLEALDNTLAIDPDYLNNGGRFDETVTPEGFDRTIPGDQGARIAKREQMATGALSDLDATSVQGMAAARLARGALGDRQAQALNDETMAAREASKRLAAVESYSQTLLGEQKTQLDEMDIHFSTLSEVLQEAARGVSVSEMKPAGVPLAVDGQLVGTSGVSKNFEVQDPSHGGVFTEDWMAKAPVEEVDADTFADAPFGAPDPPDAYRAALASGEWGNPKIYKVTTQNGDVANFLEIRNIKDGRRAPLRFALKDLPTGEVRGQEAFYGAADSRLEDTLPAIDEAFRVASGAQEGLNRVMDDTLQATRADEFTREASAEVSTIFMSGAGRVLDMSAEQRQAASVASRKRVNDLAILVDEQKKALGNLIPPSDTAGDAISAVARLRASARQLAAQTGDPRIFDEADLWYRRNEYAKTQLRPEPRPLKRTSEDAYSEYLDVVNAVQQKVQAKAGKAYDALSKRGKKPPMPREAFIEAQLRGSMAKLNDQYAQTLTLTNGKAPEELIRQVDRMTKRVISKHRINPKDISFRGDSAGYQTMLDDGHRWFAQQGGKDLTLASRQELMDLAKKARDERAPTAVFDYLKSELQRRAESRPARRYPVSEREFDGVLREAGEEIEALVSEATRLELYGAKVKEYPKTFLEKLIRRASEIVRTQASPDMQVSQGVFVPYLGKSFEEPIQALIDPQAQAYLRDVIPHLRRDSQATESLVSHRMGVALRDLDTAVEGYMLQARKTTGRTLQKDAVYRAMYDAYTSKDRTKLPPELQAALMGPQMDGKGGVSANLNELSKMVQEGVDDPEMRATIQDNLSSYVFRSYSIFRDPDAIFKSVDRTSTPYRELVKSIREQRGAEIYEKAYKAFGHKLDGEGLNEAGKVRLIEKYVDDAIEGEISALIKKNLKFPDSTAKISPLIGKPSQEYLIQRVLDDPNLRKIMGEEAHFGFAASLTAQKIGADIAKAKLIRGLLDSFRQVGMVADAPIKDVADVQISKTTLEKVGQDLPPGGTLFVNAKLAEILRGAKDPMPSGVAAINTLISSVKAGLIASPGGFMANSNGLLWMLPLGNGTMGLVRALADNDIVYASQVAREVTAPGKAGAKPGLLGKVVGKDTALGIYKALGFKDEADIRVDAEDFIRLGLDLGGEFATELKQFTQPLVEGADLGKPARLLQTAVHRFTEFYRRPDLFAKIVAYRSFLQDSMWKEGISTPSDAMKRIAVEKALNVTQNPQTTPVGIRNLSRGVTGLATAGFQGFFYQMARNVAYSVKYGLDDLAMASKYAAEGDLKKASRYAMGGTDRLVTTALAGYYMTNALMDLLGEDQDKAKYVRHFLWGDKRNSRILLQGIEREGGKTTAKMVDMGSVDPYENTARILTVLAKPGDTFENLKAAVKEVQVQMLSPSMFVEALLDITGYEYRTGASGSYVRQRGTTSREHGVNVGPAFLSVEGAYKGIRKVMPTVGRVAIDLGRAATGMANPDLLDPNLEKVKTQLIRQGSGVRTQKLDLNIMVSRRLSEDWASTAGTRTNFNREYKAAQSWTAKREIIKKYEKDWDKGYSLLKSSITAAVGLEYTTTELKKIMESKDYKLQIPPEVRKRVVYRRPMSLSDYARTLD